MRKLALLTAVFSLPALTFRCGSTVGEIDDQEISRAPSGARPEGDERATSPNGPQDANPPTTSVIGVDRVGQAEALREHGASIVVSDLSELLKDR